MWNRAKPEAVQFQKSKHCLLSHSILSTIIKLKENHGIYLSRIPKVIHPSLLWESRFFTFWNLENVESTLEINILGIKYTYLYHSTSGFGDPNTSNWNVAFWSITAVFRFGGVAVKKGAPEREVRNYLIWFDFSFDPSVFVFWVPETSRHRACKQTHEYEAGLRGLKRIWVYCTKHFFIGNSIFHLSLELPTKFWKTNLKVA